MTDQRSPGRPRIYGEPAAETIRVRVATPVRAELQRIADESGLRLSDVVRQALDDRVERDDDDDRTP